MSRPSLYRQCLLLRWLAGACGLLACAIAQGAIPAFPGAEGAGAYAAGGRGGDVYHVTNTNPSGAGSLAYGLTTGVPSAGRTIVFDVSGYAHISKTLRVTASKITIAGQTAPGDGFGLKDGTFLVSGDDIVIRHLRFRNGNNADSIDLDAGSLNAIFDHCDALFSTDENMSSFGSPPENLTYQWGLNAWGLESHSCGGLWDQNHATCHHTLWAHNHTRNPKARPQLLDWVNNVTFDWDIGFILGDSESPANWNTNVVGSYFISGTAGKTSALDKGGRDRNGAWNFHVFINPASATAAPFHNLFDGDANHVLDGSVMGWSRVSGDVEHLTAPLVNVGIPVTQDPPLTAYKKIVSAAGPLRLDVDPARPVRDEVAGLLITELVAQTHHHLSHVTGTGLGNEGFGTLSSTAAPIDTDQDGMPDYYEAALGWSVATDDHNTALLSSGGVITATTYLPAGTVAGYTRLEEYLHFLAIPHGRVAKNVSGTPSSIAIDLRKFTGGFANAPTFTVAGVVGGTVALGGTGSAIATFTPMLDYTGRARFDFTVTDAQGSTWTQTCALVVSNTGHPRDLTWQGDNAANNWDETTLNWKRNGGAVDFNSGDSVTFDELGAKAVTVVGALPLPSSMVVDAVGNYAFGGTGSITASGPLTKRGAGKLTFLDPVNSFTALTVEAGTLELGLGGGLSGGPLSLLDGATFANLSTTATATLPNALDVPAGQSATFKTGNRLVLNGATTGGGNLTYQVETSVSRFDLKGAMAAYTGKLNFTNAGTAGAGVRLFFNGGSFNGFDGASIDLGGSVSLQPQTNSGGNTLNIGALSGSSSAANLSGGTAGAVALGIGAAGLDTAYAGSLTGNATLTKIGAGRLTLGGTNTYTGATTLTAGELEINGSLANTPVAVASGARLSGGGSIGGVVSTQAGAVLAPGSRTAVGNLTVGTGLTVVGSGLNFRLSATPDATAGTPNAANDRLTLSGGTLDLNNGAANNLNLTYLDGALGIGTYTLITGGTTTSGAASNLTFTPPTGTRQTYALALPAGKLQIVVGGSPSATLIWSGTLTGQTWDLGATANFTGADGKFFNLDAVTLDDSSSNNTVTLSGALAPRALTVSATKNYILAGSGTLSGAGVLTKSGAGSLTLGTTGVNSYSGGTLINAGAVLLGNAAANAGGLGTGAVTLNGGTLSMYSAGLSTYAGLLPNAVVVNTTGTLNVAPRGGFSGAVSGSGVLTYYTPYVRGDITGDWSAFTGRVNVTTDGDGGDFRIASSYSWPGLAAASVNLADRVSFYFSGILAAGAGTSIEVGELSGGPLSTLLGGATGGRNFTYTIGGKTGVSSEVTFAGNIAEQNTSTATNYIKTGLGTWTLSGNCTYNGGTTVAQGTLRVLGTLTSAGSYFQILDGARLDLANGSIATNEVTVAPTGTLTGFGTLRGDLNNQGLVDCRLGGTLTVTGDVVNDGTMRLANRTALAATGSFINNGVLDLLTGSGSLPTNLDNHGVILDSSLVRVASAAKNGSSFICTVRGFAGHVYQLQGTGSLTSTWTNIGAAQTGLDPGDGATPPPLLTFTDNGGATGMQKFYRVVITP